MNRYASDKVRYLLDHFPAVAIIGARQVGKTSLAKSLFPDWTYLDLENSQDIDQLQFDTHYFFDNHPEHVIIDEAQAYPDLFPALRGIIDQQRQRKGRFLLTGSSSPELISHISETLAGRIAIVELGTLKAGEQHNKPFSPLYDIFKQPLSRDYLPEGLPPLSRHELQAAWFYGGYPEPRLTNDDVFWSQWMENYRATYINRDVGRLFPKLNRLAYRRFLETLGHLSCAVLNKSNLARSIEVSEGTVREYLQIAQGTFLWRQINSYEKSGVKSLLKMPKGYIRDSGLLHYLLRINSLEQLHSTAFVGHSFESFVIEEIMKGLHATLLTNWDAYYYRTKSGAEIDLILEGPFGVLPIEIKFGSTVNRRSLMTLENFVITHKLPFGVLINQAADVAWVTRNIVQIPAGWI